MLIEIIYTQPVYLESLQLAIDAVAREGIYLEKITSRPLQDIISFENQLIERNFPTFIAIDVLETNTHLLSTTIHPYALGSVVGWIDIFYGNMSNPNPRMIHRGGLGMGIISNYRNQKIGTKLLQAALDHVKKYKLFEKIELSVYTDNLPAIQLYKKFGFSDYV